jgi:hypothetical protein
MSFALSKRAAGYFNLVSTPMLIISIIAFVDSKA